MNCKFDKKYCEKHDERNTEIADPYMWIDMVCKACPRHPNQKCMHAPKITCTYNCLSCVHGVGVFYDT